MQIQKNRLQGTQLEWVSTSIYTHTNRCFACSVTGVKKKKKKKKPPPTDLESFYNKFYGNTGTNILVLWEIGTSKKGRWLTQEHIGNLSAKTNPISAKTLKVPFMNIAWTAEWAGSIGPQGLDFKQTQQEIRQRSYFLILSWKNHHPFKEEEAPIKKIFKIRMKQYFDPLLMDKEFLNGCKMV